MSDFQHTVSATTWPRPVPGVRVGRYQLTERLGEGGMAEVWKGVRESEVGGAKKTVAVKLIASHSARDPKFQEMFLREARVSMLLNHANICQVFDVGRERDKLYMAMEYVHGLNLAQLLARLGGELLPFSIISYIIGHVLQALAYAHDLETDDQQLTVVHRDISPHNIMLSVAGEVKVADFGVASVSAEETTGTVRGKLQYMPKEQLLGDSRAPTIDLFSVGAVLHELIEGRPFRHAVDAPRMYGMILSGETPPLERVDVPRTLLLLRNRLVEPEAARRPPSARVALQYVYNWDGYRNESLQLGELVKRLRAQPEPSIEVALDPEHPAGYPSEQSTERAPPGEARQAQIRVLDGSRTWSAVPTVEAPAQPSVASPAHGEAPAAPAETLPEPVETSLANTETAPKPGGTAPAPGEIPLANSETALLANSETVPPNPGGTAPAIGETALGRTTPEHTADTLTQPRAIVAPRRRNTGFGPLVAALLITTVTVIVLGFSLDWWNTGDPVATELAPGSKLEGNGSDPSQHRQATTPTDPPPGEPVPGEPVQGGSAAEKPPPTGPASTQPVPEEPLPVPKEPVPEEPVPVPEEPAPGPVPLPKQKATPTPVAPVSVTLSAAAQYKTWVQLLIKGKEYEIDWPNPTTVIQLRPGVVRVKYRKTKDGEWQDAGEVRIPKEPATLFLANGHASIQ